MENWKEAYRNNTGLLLFGDVGTGKSFFAGCIANALLDRDVPVPVSYTHLDVYKRQDIIITDQREGNKQNNATYWAARIKQYGAMRAVGMDNRQLKRMISAEAYTYARCV